MPTDFPARGQKAPNYWDDQLHAYIDEGLAKKPTLVSGKVPTSQLPPIPDSPDDIGAAPAVHTHSASQVSGLPAAIDDALVAGANITMTFDALAGTITVAAAGGDAEFMRDTIAAALVGANGIAVVVDDPGNTITISLSAASEAGRGGLRIATDSEAVSGIDDLTAMTPQKVKMVTDNLVTALDIVNVVRASEPGITLVVSETDPGVLDPGEVWVGPSDGMILKTIIDAKGDLLVGSAADTVIRKAVGSNGQVFTADSSQPGGTKWATPAASGRGAKVLAMHNPALGTSVVNTTTETDLFSMTLAAADLAAGDVIDGKFIWEVLNNSGSAVNYTYKLKLGGTTLWQSAPLSMGANANRPRQIGRLTLILAALNDLRGSFEIDGSTAAAGNPGGNILTTVPTFRGTGTSTIDFATDKVLALSVTMGTAATTADARPLGSVALRTG